MLCTPAAQSVCARDTRVPGTLCCASGTDPVQNADVPGRDADGCWIAACHPVPRDTAGLSAHSPATRVDNAGVSATGRGQHRCMDTDAAHSPCCGYAWTVPGPAPEDGFLPERIRREAVDPDQRDLLSLLNPTSSTFQKTHTLVCLHGHRCRR